MDLNRAVNNEIITENENNRELHKSRKAVATKIHIKGTFNRSNITSFNT